eukprot:IDg10251t1
MQLERGENAQLSPAARATHASAATPRLDACADACVPFPHPANCRHGEPLPLLVRFCELFRDKSLGLGTSKWGTSMASVPRQSRSLDLSCTLWCQAVSCDRGAHSNAIKLSQSRKIAEVCVCPHVSR